ncbi:MAG: glycerol-3-phosphate 1-O-acyltransferase PlsY [Kofleriaceae bacterium]
MFARMALLLFGYWAGAVPFGVLIAKWLGVDIREHGSGNIGATNVTRVLGPVPGAIVLVLDAMKGAVPVWLAIRYSGEPWMVMATGFAAIIGHCFSPFLEFRGGKGVATAMGVFLVLDPAVTAIGVLTFVAVLEMTKVPALGSLSAGLMIALVFTYHHESEAATLAFLVFALMLYTHRTNLAKLRKGKPV